MNMFKTVKGSRVGKSKFNLSHEKKFSFNMGELIPTMLTEVLPGDNFRVSSEVMLRMAPMIAPVMHRVNVFMHYFYVPSRLIWSEWEDFITGGEDGLSAPVPPFIAVKSTPPPHWNQFTKGRLSDYFGIPPQEEAPDHQFDISALPFRAYQMIYNEYYRDQNLEEKVEFGLGSGEVTDVTELSNLALTRDRAWEKDYFTSALPWPQRGPDVQLPADVEYKTTKVYDSAGDGLLVNEQIHGYNVPEQFIARDELGTTGALTVENIENLGITINDLRKSVKLQQWFEKAARAGSRYKEVLLSFFGQRSSDSRLDRPEYLGGGKSPIVMSEVLNTTQPIDAQGEPVLPQGNMSGHGISVGTSNKFKRKFEEHGYVMGICSVIPRTAYQQGLERLWTRKDKFDYAWPEFAHLGEQEIKNEEIYLQPKQPETVNKETWGYQSRYAEYKYVPSTVSGDFRDTLNFWQMSRIFQALPPLNEQFVKSDPTSRIFAVTDPDEDKLYCQIYNRVSAVRPLPYYGTPKL